MWRLSRVRVVGAFWARCMRPNGQKTIEKRARAVQASAVELINHDKALYGMANAVQNMTQ